MPVRNYSVYNFLCTSARKWSKKNRLGVSWMAVFARIKDCWSTLRSTLRRAACQKVHAHKITRIARKNEKRLWGTRNVDNLAQSLMRTFRSCHIVKKFPLYLLSNRHLTCILFYEGISWMYWLIFFVYSSCFLKSLHKNDLIKI